LQKSRAGIDRPLRTAVADILAFPFFAITRETLKLRQHVRHCKKVFLTAHLDDVFVMSDREKNDFRVAKKAVVLFKDFWRENQTR